MSPLLTRVPLATDPHTAPPLLQLLVAPHTAVPSNMTCPNTSCQEKRSNTIKPMQAVAAQHKMSDLQITVSKPRVMHYLRAQIYQPAVPQMQGSVLQEHVATHSYQNVLHT